jgi:electron transfer flavoprotein alpha subunit
VLEIYQEKFNTFGSRQAALMSREKSSRDAWGIVPGNIDGEGFVKIVLCTKQIPSVEDVRFNRETGTIVREGVPNEINPYDRRALGQAVALKKELDAEVVAVTMGPPQAVEVLWECLAAGADRAVHINDRALAGSDTLATARVLAAFLKREKADLIFCGKYSVDAETGQVGPEVAALLGIPQVTGATSLHIEGTKAQVGRETDDGIDTVEVELPALLTAAERLIRPPRVDAGQLEAAKSAQIEVLTGADLGLTPEQTGFTGSPTWVSSIDEVKPARTPIIVDDSDANRSAERVVELLRERGVFAELRASKSLEPLPERRGAPVEGKDIWVVPELIDGRIAPVTFELLSGSVKLAQDTGGRVCALVAGHGVSPLVSELGAGGADVVYVADDAHLAEYECETFTWILVHAIRRWDPWAVLVPATSNGRDFAPRVAAELDLGLTGDAIGLELDADGRLCQLKPAFGGTIVATILSNTYPQMATVRAGMLKAYRPRTGFSPEVVPIPLDGLPAPRVRVMKRETVTDEGGRLDEATVVVCAGAGLGGAENLTYAEELAHALGGVVGGTRRVVDAGWMPRQKQIGLTGVIIAPDLYIGLGVRGAFNHTIGIQRAETVVALNSDPEAPLMLESDIAVVGDYRELVPALTRAIASAAPATI